MDKNVDVLVVGAGPAGIISAVTARKYYPEKKIVVIKNIEKGVIPCGIPYMFASMKDPDENKLGNAALEKNNIDVIVDEAIRINRSKKTIETKNEVKFYYDKLILATGSIPITPPIKGINKEGVYQIYKDIVYLKKLIEQIKKAKNVLILGGGFIGVELADEISKIKGLNVFLVEMLPEILANSFDVEFSKIAEEVLTLSGVKIFKNTRVEEILGSEKVENVLFAGGKKIAVDMLIIGTGGIPNSNIASDAGLNLGKGKGIWVDEYMRTIDPDIFAVGDCAAKRDFYTHKVSILS